MFVEDIRKPCFKTRASRLAYWNTRSLSLRKSQVKKLQFFRLLNQMSTAVAWVAILPLRPMILFADRLLTWLSGYGISDIQCASLPTSLNSLHSSKREMSDR